uniref:Metalloendopeptidase n=1 Tax=Petromyzon marinus TaxID=7757 RepID=A0AAJ7SZB7_PETMA|nr:zinc metalloproteinase nas-36-like [Petromyzon marinus]
MATDERFKKKMEQVRILLDDLKKLSRFDKSTISTLQRIGVIYDPYNLEEQSALERAFHKEGGIELYMKMLTSLSPDASNVPDSLQRPMEWSTRSLVDYVTTSDQSQTFVDCGGLKFLLSLLKHHACQGLVLRFESRNTLRFAVTTLRNLSTEPELKSCFHQERAADVLACYLDVPDAPCKLSALNALAGIATEQDLDIICNAQGAISLLTDMVNRPSYKDYTLLENILYSSKGLVKTLTMVSITAGIRRKTEGASSSLDKKVLEEIIPKLREKLKVEVEKRDYTLEWGDIAVHPARRSVQKWPKARDGLIYIPYKVSVAFYNGDIKKIEEAALEFEKKTCVRFIPHSEEADYIYIHAREGNWSFLGRQGGDQAMSLEPGKVTKGVVLHELMHALGFHHEHCRSDRDDHLWVHNHNIKPDWVDAIVKTTTNGHNLTTPYDYSSILHYGA